MGGSAGNPLTLSLTIDSSVGGMMTGIISGMIRFIKTRCVEFPLVVSVSVTFLLFQLLV